MEFGGTIASLGEKRLLREVILPIVNPSGDSHLAGDDCGIIEIPGQDSIVISTDRVPWDLTGYKYNIMSEYDIGFYLALLNISDIAAMGAQPLGLVANLALPNTFPIHHLKEILRGIVAAGDTFACPLMGGDLSDSLEPSLSATSIGRAKPGELLMRAGSATGDMLYMTGPCGLAAAAYRYFRHARQDGMSLSMDKEVRLIEALARSKPRLMIGRQLAHLQGRRTAMDNTDGLSQTLIELAQINGQRFMIHGDKLPIDSLAIEVAEYLGEDPIHLAMGPGADFNLVGTVSNRQAAAALDVLDIGNVEKGQGVLLRKDGVVRQIKSNGWDYFQEQLQ